MNKSFSSLSSTSSGTQSSLDARSAFGTPRRGPLDIALDQKAFLTLCCSHLTSILDLSDDKLHQVLDDGKENAAKNASETIRKSLGSFLHRKRKTSRAVSSSCRLFGSFLPEPNGPSTILQLIELLREKHATTGGLFRVSGSKKRQDQLKRRLDDAPGDFLDVDELNKQYNPHDIASVVKQYFAELPESILQAKNFVAYEQVADLKPSVKTEAIQLLLLLLPPVNRNTLYLLLQLMHCVAQHCSENRMDARNLAIIMAPNLVGCSSFPQGLIVSKLVPVVEHMVEYFSEIFQIPSDIQRHLRIHASRKNSIEDETDGVPMTRPYCAQSSKADYERQMKDTTQRELAKLYQHIHNMPEGKDKQSFLKRLHTSMPGTPPFVPPPRRKRPLEEYNVAVYGTPKVSVLTGKELNKHFFESSMTPSKLVNLPESLV